LPEIPNLRSGWQLVELVEYLCLERGLIYNDTIFAFIDTIAMEIEFTPNNYAFIRKFDPA
jgi:hypothetical protein